MKQLVKRKIFSIPVIFNWLVLLVFLATPVFSMNGNVDLDEGILTDVPYSEAAQYLAQTQESLNSKVIRSRLVRVDFDRAFRGIENESLSTQSRLNDKLIHFNLFYDVDFLVRIDKTIDNLSGSTTLVGVDIGDGPSSAIFTVKDGIMVGSFSKGNRNYIIRYIGGGIHEVQETDHSRYEGCEEPLHANPVKMPVKDGVDEQLSSPQANTVITAMVVYTGSARSAAGGTTAIQNLINQAVNESNVGYGNSAVNITLSLVHTAEVTYSESGFNWFTCLDRLVGTSDGFMDNVHSLRNSYAADVVVLIVNNAQYCGLANAIMANASGAFCLVSRTCATGYYSFAHEIGHLQGARHDRYVDNTDGSPYNYNHGRTYPAGGWRTIMAYNNACSAQGTSCTRINYWSNPSVYYGGVATGISGGAGVGADNHLCLNNTATTVANFRTGGPQNVTFQCIADAFVRQDNPNVNYGSSKLLRVRATNTGNGISSYLKFNVTGITRAIKTATLRIKNTSTYIPSSRIYWIQNTTWSEYGITWNNAPLAFYSQFAIGSVPSNQWKEIDVKSFVSTNRIYTFGLTAADMAGLAYNSRESVDKPTLIITTY
jgi:hypothetical protein